MNLDTLKKCSKCKENKDFSCFGKYKYSKDGYKEICKICRQQESKLYYIKKDKKLHLLESLRHRAKLLKVPFNLTLEDLEIPEKCPVFGVPLQTIEPYSKKSKRFSPSVDRIIPELGYVKGNIQIISNLANVMKHNATIQELLLFANWAKFKYENQT